LGYSPDASTPVCVFVVPPLTDHVEVAHENGGVEGAEIPLARGTNTLAVDSRRTSLLVDDFLRRCEFMQRMTADFVSGVPDEHWDFSPSS
jgi:hypothetical protein